ncbi:hypothetical protein Nepgr_022554 [Nepenthes gracilis]|uniref:Uncharacterized protein n=1 Tax=Nepenthes gracilis TaxID=150966 RepID=A0AAD3XX44_NEPGR|nr:hypothetical protein Nepgr_022554 [Nepenthes gracilis]
MQSKYGCKSMSLKKLRRRRFVRQSSSSSSSVQNKVRKLQTLIPGAEGMLPDSLFLRTADYILQLRFLLHLLQALSKIYTPSNQ